MPAQSTIAIWRKHYLGQHGMGLRDALGQAEIYRGIGFYDMRIFGLAHVKPCCFCRNHVTFGKKKFVSFFYIDFRIAFGDHRTKYKNDNFPLKSTTLSGATNTLEIYYFTQCFKDYRVRTPIACAGTWGCDVAALGRGLFYQQTIDKPALRLGFR